MCPTPDRLLPIRFPTSNAEEPHGLLALDPRLICYSWITGISDVALVVFVREHQPETQYLRTSISEEQRREFSHLVGTTIGQIEAVQFPSHSGIRFPQNGCVSCSHIGLCLDDQKLIDASLIRTAKGSNVKRATFVPGKIDEILAWEKERGREQDLRFVDLGRCLCELRAGQYWRLEKMKSFDNFLGKRFPDSRRKAYYLMAIHENLTRVPKQQLREIGWTKATELAKLARREGRGSKVQPGCTRPGRFLRKSSSGRSSGI
jgi:hypothetical protein